MINNQEYITKELEKIPYKILPITSKRLKNLVYIIIGIILSKSVVISDISEKLKDDFTDATEESKIKRIYRFFSSSTINSEYIYSFFIEEILKKYVKRSNNNKVIIIFDHTTLDDMLVKIEGKNKIKYLRDITPIKKAVKKFNEILLSSTEYKCNLAVCRAEESEDPWYLATNMNSKEAVKEYKKRFIIEEMFRDLKANGFDMEGTWTEDIVYFKNLYLCLSIAYTWMIILGADCSKNKKSKINGEV